MDNNIFDINVSLDSKGVYARHLKSLFKYAFHRSAKKGEKLGLSIPEMTEIARTLLEQIMENSKA